LNTYFCRQFTLSPKRSSIPIGAPLSQYAISKGVLTNCHLSNPVFLPQKMHLPRGHPSLKICFFANSLLNISYSVKLILLPQDSIRVIQQEAICISLSGTVRSRAAKVAISLAASGRFSSGTSMMKTSNSHL